VRANKAQNEWGGGWRELWDFLLVTEEGGECNRGYLWCRVVRDGEFRHGGGMCVRGGVGGREMVDGEGGRGQMEGGEWYKWSRKRGVVRCPPDKTGK